MLQLCVQPPLPDPPQDQSKHTTFATTSPSSTARTDSVRLVASDGEQSPPLIASVTQSLASPTTPNASCDPSAQSASGQSHSPLSSNTTSPLVPDKQPSTSPPIALSSPTQSVAAAPTAPATATTVSFCVNELVWGPARGHPAWPGKVVTPPVGVATSSDSTWVQWFGGRPHHIELVTIGALKSLSEGLEAHHRAQKDTRK